MVLNRQNNPPFNEAGLPANAALPDSASLGRRAHQALQAGQTLLFVILAIIAVSVVGLSVASISIIGLKSSTEEAESQKALAAAEAGIERALQAGVTAAGMVLNDSLSNNSQYSVDIKRSNLDNSNFLIYGGNAVSKDEGADIWFADVDANGNPDYSTIPTFNNYLNLYWGSTSEDCSDSNFSAALEVIVVTRDALSPNAIKTYRYAYDGCSRGNNFAQVQNEGYTLSIDGKQYKFKYRTTPQDSLAKGLRNIVLVRVVPIYKDAVIGVSACDYSFGSCTILPSQGYIATSIGTAGQASRKLEVFNGYHKQTYLPFVAYGLFVPNSF